MIPLFIYDALQTMLSGRYYDQTITVVNQGLGGEFVSSGLRRLPGVLASVNPQVVLLLEGANDLTLAVVTGQNRAALPSIADTLREMITLAHRSGIQVLMATLTPERRNSPKGTGADLIVPLNDLIRWGAEREGAPVIDLFQALGGGPDPYVGTDGLHPNAAGYQRVGETFFDALRVRFEAAPIRQFLTMRR